MPIYLQHFSGGLREDGGVGDLCGQVLQDCLQPLQIHQHSCLHILHEQEERREEKREGEREKKEGRSGSRFERDTELLYTLKRDDCGCYTAFG